MRFRILLSDKEYLTSFIEMSSKIDKNLLIDLTFDGFLYEDELLITDIAIDILSHQYPSINSNSICFLSSTQDDENLTTGPFRLFKFQNFDDLISKIKLCGFSHFGGNTLRVSNNYKVGFVFDSDVYYSDFVLQFAKQVVYKHGLNVLVFPLQFISSSYGVDYSSYNDTYIFKKLIYMINKQVDIPIDSFFSIDSLGFYHFKSSLVLNPIAAMDDTSFDMLIHYISERFFDVICFDIGRCLNKRNINLLQEMNKVIVLSRNHVDRSSSSSLMSELDLFNSIYINPDSDGSKLEISINELIDVVIKS
ncbi:hypothetical protein [Mogibacterium pumilum]|uniref:Uncharacterized protein n=1 Tax=Mogibacterium pumilum TaxID=86332 RepID=A0A223ASG9_9FIRM|nr:hypothetical protein [Mogibacterium pumilum]ASS37894.1 hypothetical protein AXF17_05250 [Mogibacterium pumilum]